MTVFDSTAYTYTHTHTQSHTHTRTDVGLPVSSVLAAVASVQAAQAAAVE